MPKIYGGPPTPDPNFVRDSRVAWGAERLVTVEVDTLGHRVCAWVADTIVFEWKPPSGLRSPPFDYEWSIGGDTVRFVQADYEWSIGGDTVRFVQAYGPDEGFDTSADGLTTTGRGRWRYDTVFVNGVKRFSSAHRSVEKSAVRFEIEAGGPDQVRRLLALGRLRDRRS